MKILRAWLWVVCLAVAFAAPAFAQSQESIIGLWQANDDDSQSLIRITGVDGKVIGRLAWVRGKTQSDVCNSCAGTPKLLGLPMLTGLTLDASQSGQWSNGQLLNPKNGKTYDVTASLADQGKILVLDVSAGLFSKTVKWQRVPQDELKAYPNSQVAVGAAG